MATSKDKPVLGSGKSTGRAVFKTDTRGKEERREKPDRREQIRLAEVRREPADRRKKSGWNGSDI